MIRHLCLGFSFLMWNPGSLLPGDLTHPAADEEEQLASTRCQPGSVPGWTKLTGQEIPQELLGGCGFIPISGISVSQTPSQATHCGQNPTQEASGRLS